MELVDFLRARLDEDEAAARGLLEDKRPGRAERWEFCDDGAIRDTGRGRSLRVKFTWAPEADHIARHDPARVLAEVDAKRRMLDWLAGRDEWALDNDLWTWDSDGALCLLALPYADHPDYRDEWRP